MIFLWNEERVVLEILELARLRIARKLEVSLDQVSARVDVRDGKLLPLFDVEQDMDTELVAKTVKAVWGYARGELQERIASLGERRYGY